MAWYNDLANAAMTAVGAKSSRDNEGFQNATNTFNEATDRNYQNYLGNAADLKLNAARVNGQNWQAGTQEAYQNQLANYQQQQGAAGMLYNQATGNTPSVADLQMQAGLGLANNQVQSAMLSQQGGVMPGLSQRNMLNAQAMQNAGIVGQGQIARAGEMNAAQQNYAALLGQMGQTAAGMTGVQNTMGQQQYQQAMDYQNYRTQMAAQQNQMAQNTAATKYGATTGNLQGMQAALAQQGQNLFNTASAVATGGASLLSNKPAAGAAK